MRSEDKGWDLPALFLAAIAAILAVSLGTMLVYSLPRGLDLTDESSYVYLLSHPATTGFVMDHVVWSKLLPANASMLHFRWLAVLTLLASAVAVLLSFFHYSEQSFGFKFSRLDTLLCASLGLAGAMLYFAGVRPTMSYSTTLVVGGYLFLAGLLWMAHARSFPARGLAILLMAMALTLIWLARFVVCLPLLLLALVFLRLIWGSWPRAAAVSALTVVATATMIALLWSQGFDLGGQMGLISALAKTSHGPAGVIFYDLQYGALIFAMASGIAFCASLAERRFGPVRFAWLAILLLGLCVAGAVGYMAWRGDFELSAAQGAFAFNLPLRSMGPAIHVGALTVLIFHLLSYWRVHRTFSAVTPERLALKRALGLAVLLYAAALVPELGTNTGLWRRSILSMAPLFLMVGLFIALAVSRHRMSRWGAPLLLLLIAAPVLAAVYANTISRPFRVNGSATEQTARLSRPAALRGLYVSPQVAALQKSLEEGISQLGAPASAPMIYADGHAGILLLASARVLGAPWYTIGYPNIEHWNCALAESGLRAVPPVVIGVDVDQMGPYLRRCLSDYAFGPVKALAGPYRLSLLRRLNMP